MSGAEKYRTYREADRKLHRKLMHRERLPPDAMMKSGKLLRIVRDKTFVFESSNEMNAVADLAIHEYRLHGKTVVERYGDEVGGQDEIEQEIVNGYIRSYTSLFRVVTVSRVDRTLLLRDLLAKRDDVELTDIQLSQSAVPGLLLFIRVVPLQDFSMTSGVIFAFPVGRDEQLLKKYRKLSARGPSGAEAMKRSIAFFWLNRTEGMEVGYEE